eukprot:6201428-Pleurochrysis_carterae.AAC.2
MQSVLSCCVLASLVEVCLDLVMSHHRIRFQTRPFAVVVCKHGPSRRDQLLMRLSRSFSQKGVTVNTVGTSSIT